jgi:hypothetical protein
MALMLHGLYKGKRYEGSAARRFLMCTGPPPLTPEQLAALAAEALELLPQAVRYDYPGGKRGRALSYQRLQALAPQLEAFYHSQALRAWVTAAVGAAVLPTAGSDPSSASLLVYDAPGDFIGAWQKGCCHSNALTIANAMPTATAAVVGNAAAPISPRSPSPFAQTGTLT